MMNFKRWLGETDFYMSMIEARIPKIGLKVHWSEPLIMKFENKLYYLMKVKKRLWLEFIIDVLFDIHQYIMWRRKKGVERFYGNV